MWQEALQSAHEVSDRAVEALEQIQETLQREPAIQESVVQELDVISTSSESDTESVATQDEVDQLDVIDSDSESMVTQDEDEQETVTVPNI